MVTVPTALMVFALLVAAGLFMSRRLQHGYIDYLSPLVAMYAVHYLTRGALVFYQSEWLDLNAQVDAAPETAVAEAMLLAAGALCSLIVCYLIGFRIFRPGETPSRDAQPASLGWATALIVVGLACRLLLRLSVEELVEFPDWALTPVETLGWAALAGVYVGGFTCGCRPAGPPRQRAAWLVTIATIAVLVVDAQISASREMTLQPILAALVGLMMGARVPIWRAAVVGIAVSFPLFIWIGAMKVYGGLEPGQGPGYLAALPRVHEYSNLAWPQWVVGMTQDRFHGLDSLIVTRSVVPALRPYETDSLWSQVFISAFVPRALYPDKQVGWGSRFATEFWGVAPEAEGRAAAIGISHLGTFYIYGGARTCLTGMAVFGFGLGVLAAMIRRSRTVFGPALFVLTALTICQVDRDLEVVLGGVLKLLAIFASLMLLRPLGRAPLSLRAARAERRQRPRFARWPHPAGRPL